MSGPRKAWFASLNPKSDDVSQDTGIPRTKRSWSGGGWAGVNPRACLAQTWKFGAGARALLADPGRARPLLRPGQWLQSGLSVVRDEMGDQAPAETPPTGATWRLFVASSAPAQPSAGGASGAGRTRCGVRREAATQPEAACRLPPQAPLWLGGGGAPRAAAASQISCTAPVPGG